jgi:hypothetical protein
MCGVSEHCISCEKTQRQGLKRIFPSCICAITDFACWWFDLRDSCQRRFYVLTYLFARDRSKRRFHLLTCLFAHVTGVNVDFTYLLIFFFGSRDRCKRRAWEMQSDACLWVSCSLHMYVCMICMYVCMHVCIYACIYVWYVCMYTCIMICMCMYVCIYVWYVCMYACMYICMYDLCVWSVICT